MTAAPWNDLTDVETVPYGFPCEHVAGTFAASLPSAASLLITSCLTAEPRKHLEERITLRSVVAAMKRIATARPVGLMPLAGLAVHPDVLLKFPKAQTQELYPSILPPLPAYGGIEVVIDPTLPPGGWRLR